MKDINWLIQVLTEIKEKHGNLPIDILTETDLAQVQQELGGIAVSSSGNQKRLILLPEDS